MVINVKSEFSANRCYENSNDKPRDSFPAEIPIMHERGLRIMNKSEISGSECTAATSAVEQCISRQLELQRGSINDASKH